MMIDIASTLNYVKFDEVKDCATTYEMWIKLLPMEMKTMSRELRKKFSKVNLIR